MKKVSIIIILLSVFCMGCKIHCPEFPANLNYFPYYEGQELKFTNSQQDIQSFIVSSKNDSKASSFGQNCKCVCHAGSVFRTTENRDSLSLRCGLEISGGRNDLSNSVSISCDLQYSYLYSDYLSTGLNLEKTVPYDELYKYLEDTIIIENENNQIVKKIVIVKGKGLISYTTADGEEWKLVE